MQPEPETLTAEFNTLAHVARDPALELRKKAKRKALTVFLAGKLIELDTDNVKAYRNMYYCNSALEQDGQELKEATYCKNRLCAVCGAIKTANLINGYMPELKKMSDPIFLTLTIKAVEGRFLKTAINRMNATIRQIQKHLTKYHKVKLFGLRKLECNYNPKKNTYNPHYHFIIDGEAKAELLRKMWLQYNPTCDPRAQKAIPADMDTMIELFKYATKIIAKDGLIHALQIDVIYTALRHKRTIQSMGIKKQVDEDEREKVIYDHLAPDNTNWIWNQEATDWINQETGECLTGFTPDKELKLLFEQLRE